jgi:transposase
MKEVFGGMPRSRMALETGMHSQWVSRLLSELTGDNPLH